MNKLSPTEDGKGSFSVRKIRKLDGVISVIWICAVLIHLWSPGHICFSNPAFRNTTLEKGREFQRCTRPGLTLFPFMWKVDGSVECLLLRDELWTNAQNSPQHQQAYRKAELSPAARFSCQPTIERLFRVKAENQSSTPAHAKDRCVADSQAGYFTTPKLFSKKTVFPRAFALVTHLASKAQPLNGDSCCGFKSQTCSGTSCPLLVCGSKNRAQKPGVISWSVPSQDRSVSAVSKPTPLPPTSLPLTGPTRRWQGVSCTPASPPLQHQDKMSWTRKAA